MVGKSSPRRIKEDQSIFRAEPDTAAEAPAFTIKCTLQPLRILMRRVVQAESADLERRHLKVQEITLTASIVAKYISLRSLRNSS
jgi:hypothetical protein